MNNNCTHKRSGNFVVKVQGFFLTLPVLPAGFRAAVNFLLAQFDNLFGQPAIIQPGIFNFFRNEKQQLNPKPVFVMHGSCSYKKADHYPL